MNGMIGSGEQMGNSALKSLQSYSSEYARAKAQQETADKADEAAQKQQNASLGMAGGAMAGALYMSASGPVGMAIGAAVGAIIGGLGGSLF